MITWSEIIPVPATAAGFNPVDVKTAEGDAPNARFTLFRPAGATAWKGEVPVPGTDFPQPMWVLHDAKASQHHFLEGADWAEAESTATQYIAGLLEQKPGMKITVNDDCKGKWQSWTAKLLDEDGYEQFCAYGADQEKAIDNLQIEVLQAESRLRAVNWNQTPLQVGPDGKPMEAGPWQDLEKGTGRYVTGAGRYAGRGPAAKVTRVEEGFHWSISAPTSQGTVRGGSLREAQLAADAALRDAGWAFPPMDGP